MLKASIHKGVTDIPLRTIYPGSGPENSGSITDYKPKGTRIVMFFHPENDFAVVAVSKPGVTFESGELRATIPAEGLETIKEMRGKQRFELPFEARTGPATLVLELL